MAGSRPLSTSHFQTPFLVHLNVVNDLKQQYCSVKRGDFFSS